MIQNILVLLHVITAAGWFGLALSIGGLVRQAAADGSAGIIEEGTKTVKLMNTFVILTLVFGLIAFFVGGGFAAYGPQYHTSILLVVILAVIQFVLIGSGWKSLAGQGDSTSARKKVAMGTGIGHLIWLVVLVLMFWTHYPLA